MYDLTTDNIFLDANGKSVLEVDGGGTTHFILPDGTETNHGGTADHFVKFDIQGFALNFYLDETRLSDGSLAFTSVSYDNSDLPPFAEVLLKSLFFGGEPASVFRHSNTYQFIKQDGHGTRVEQHYVDGRLRSAQYDYADGRELFVTQDAGGNVTRYQAIRPGVGVVNWTPNLDGTWTESHSGSVLSGPVAVQDIANDAATLWAAGKTVAVNNGLLALQAGGLVINNNFQFAISNNGSSLLGTDTALIGASGSTLIGASGSTLINSHGAGHIGLETNGLIASDGASLITSDGAGLIGASGSTIAPLITSDGAGLVRSYSSAINPDGHARGTSLVHSLVFADTNFNGQFDKGEPWTVTDADGHYSLPGGSGPLTVLEGVDAGTNLPFTQSFEAPVGASVISPLTTLTTELWKQVGSVAKSVNTVDAAFGLGSADLTKLDPVAGLQNGDAASAKVYVAGTKVFDTMEIMSAALNGKGANLMNAGHAVVLAMVDNLKQGGPLDLGDVSTVASLFTKAASTVGLDGSAIAGSVAGIVVSTNAQLDAALSKDAVGAGLLSDLAAVETSVQGSITSALTAAAGDAGKIGDIAKTFGVHLTGTQSDDSFTAPGGAAQIDALGGNDTITFGFKLTDATISFSGNQVIVDSSGSHTVLTGFEKYVFTDGAVNNNDSDPLVDDLFYYSRNHDVWNAQVDADAHFHASGWHEGRDPNAFFSTATYLSSNPDVKAAGIDPLVHFDKFGWKEGRAPSLNFSDAAYFAANPDVKAVGADPLAHFLQYGEQEGRQPIALAHLLAPNGFDSAYYLQHNPDVAAAGVDPYQHFETVGWKEGRNPNALFDVKGYLANYADVKAAGVNPLDHYDQFGWHEGRDPSVNFDTTDYLGHYPDVAAAHIDPLVHFLQYGQTEGRSAFADGIWG